MILLLSGGITAEVRTNGDHGHAAGTGRRKLSLAQVQGPNTVITAEVAVRAGGFDRNGGIFLFTCPVYLPLHMPLTLGSLNFVCLFAFFTRERKKRNEKVRRKSRSRSVNPPAFRGRNTAMDAQEALARRQGKS